MKSQVELSTMLFVLILSVMAAFCSAKDKKPPDTKVTAFILMATEHWFDYSWIMLVRYGKNRNK